MKKSEVISKTRFYTKASSDDYSDAQILADYNQFRRKMLLFVIRSQGYSNVGFKEIYTDLVDYREAEAGAIGHLGLYAFDMSILKTDRIEVKLSATGDYVEAEIISENDNRYSDFQDINANFSASEPKVIIRQNTYCVRPYPEEAVTAGLRLIVASNNGAYLNSVTDKEAYGNLTADNDVDLILDVNFHEIYPRLLALEYFSTDPDKYVTKITLQKNEIAEIQDSIDDHYSTAVQKLLVFKPVIHNFK